MLDLKKCRFFASEQLKNRYKIPVISIILVEIFSLVFYMIKDNIFSLRSISVSSLSLENMLELEKYLASHQKEILVVLGISILSFLILQIIQFAITCVYIKMSQGPEPVTFKDFLSGFAKWKRGLFAAIWVTLWSLIWGLAFGLAGGLLAIPFGLESTTTIPIISIVIIIPYIIKIMDYFFTVYIAAEYENISVPQAMELSKTLAKNAKRGMFYAMITTVGIVKGIEILMEIIFGSSDYLDYIIEIVSLAASCFFVPVYHMFMINIYHSQLKDALEAQIIQPEDLQ